MAPDLVANSCNHKSEQLIENKASQGGGGGHYRAAFNLPPASHSAEKGKARQRAGRAGWLAG